MGMHALTQFHESPVVLGAWQRAWGPLLEWLTPARRRHGLAVAAVAVGIGDSLSRMEDARRLDVPKDWLGLAIVIALLFGTLWLSYCAAASFARLPEAIRRRPQLTLHAAFWLLLAALWALPSDGSLLRTVLVGLAAVMPLVIWRIGYLLLSGQRGKMKGTTFKDHLIYLLPAWGGSNTPYGKGLDYLSRHEAKTPEQLARSQLAGLKLFVLAGLWILAAKLMDGAVYGVPGHQVTNALGGASLGLPKLSSLVDSKAAVALPIAWASLYAELVYQVLRHAAQGHVIVGILRFAGFNVFRNTYKPLLSQSVVQFWNRYYYYFKELMSEMFFLPTFARRFKTRPRLRLFAAVMAAAFLGNAYYHLLNREDHLVLGEAVAAWSTFNARIFYCFVLGLGIFISMLREQARAGQPASPSLIRRWISILGVWTFFALLYIWNAKGGASFTERTQFFLSLFGLA